MRCQMAERTCNSGRIMTACRPQKQPPLKARRVFKLCLRGGVRANHAVAELHHRWRAEVRYDGPVPLSATAPSGVLERAEGAALLCRRFGGASRGARPAAVSAIVRFGPPGAEGDRRSVGL